MYEQTNTTMETKTTFQIPQLLDGDDFTSEDLADDMEGLRLSSKTAFAKHLCFRCICSVWSCFRRRMP